MGVAFVLVGLTVNVETASVFEWQKFGLEIAFVLTLGFLAIYDGKWGELPVFMFFVSGGLAVALMILRGAGYNYSGEFWLSAVGSVGILGGLYLLLYLISRGKWIGDGDYILGAILGVALGNAWLALVALFVANLLGTIVTLVVSQGKAGKGTVVHFGPYLVAAYAIVIAFEPFIMALV